MTGFPGARSMSLARLLHGDAGYGDLDRLMISDISVDSRKVEKGSLFIALRGGSFDGARFAGEAESRGAAAVLVEKGEESRVDVKSIPVVGVENLRDALTLFCRRFFHHPSSKLTLVAVTGTNGKTTCAYLTAQALNHLDCKCGFIGTLGAGFPDCLRPTGLTTPDITVISRELDNMVRNQGMAACIEASSHALEQGRLDGLQVSVALFTNLTLDHLDYHRGIDAYGEAKASLFTMNELSAAVLNSDDPFSRQLERRTTAATVLRYGAGGDIRSGRVVLGERGIELDVLTPQGSARIRSRLVGRVNVDNLLAVASVLMVLGHSIDRIAEALSTASAAPGRMEVISRPGLPVVVIDYAHTPDALEKALLSVREHVAGKLWCIFGCGGDRDRGKRPLMGGIAERYADEVIITDDNPRFEPSAEIVRDITAGMQNKPVVHSDRRRAIADGISRAAQDDWILLAGKGHETTQQIGAEFHQFSDRQVVTQLLGAPQ